MGYDNKGNAIGAGQYDEVSICALLAGTKQDTTLSTSGITIDLPDEQNVGQKMHKDRRSRSDQRKRRDRYDSGHAVGKNADVRRRNDSHRYMLPGLHRRAQSVCRRQEEHAGKLSARQHHHPGSNLYCFSSSSGGIEFWHYPKGGNPFKMYGTQDEITVLAVSIGT